MHLLATKPKRQRRRRSRRSGPEPGPIVVLSAADSELACWPPREPGWRGSTRSRAFGWPTCCGSAIRCRWTYVENTLAQARLIIVRLLGGRSYWPYGVEQIAAVCRERGIAVAFLPGDDQPDAELASLSSLPPDAQHRLWRYLVEGGIDNAVELLRFAGSLIGHEGVEGARAAAPRWPLLARGRHYRAGDITDATLGRGGRAGRGAGVLSRAGAGR